MNKLKLSKKHISILTTILNKGQYRPTYSDQEPATQRLIKMGLIEWKSDFRGLKFTELGENMKNEILKLQS